MIATLGKLIAALVIGAGVAAGGWFIGTGFTHAHLGNRYVTVKGLSQRIVKADIALWPIRFVASGNDLAKVQDEIKQEAASVAKFLHTQGVTGQHIELQSLQVTDKSAQAYNSGNYKTRFVIAQTIMVRSDNVDRIAAAAQKVGKLVAAGVILNGSYGANGPSYLFTKLNAIKPQMIAEATRNARAAAEQFAKNSNARVGGIKTAHQGVFQILPRDKAPGVQQKQEIYKTLRVVSTLNYYLTD